MLGVLLFVLAAGLVVNSVLGPLILDVIDYSLSESLRNQLIGLDAVSLLLVAPLCVIAALISRRRRLAGSALALGPAGYTVYMFVQYIVGPNYEHSPKVLPLHLGLFILGGIVAVRAWAGIEPGDLPTMNDRTRRIRRWILVGLAAFVVSRYLPALLGSVNGEPLTEEFRAEPAFFWTILLMDIGIIVPITLWTARDLRRSSLSGLKATYAVIGWFALVPPSVAAMAIVMVVNDDPHRSMGAAAVFVVAAGVFAAVAISVYRPLLSTEQN